MNLREHLFCYVRKATIIDGGKDSLMRLYFQYNQLVLYPGNVQICEGEFYISKERERDRRHCISARKNLGSLREGNGEKKIFGESWLWLVLRFDNGTAPREDRRQSNLASK